MTQDLINYLSGWIPLGVWLPLLIGALFTFLWWTVWAGTGFWNIKRFWRSLWTGWIVIFGIYTAAWFYRRPPPIPIRVVITTCTSDLGSPESTALSCAEDFTRDFLRTSKKPFVLLDEAYIPALNSGESEVSMDSIAHRLRASWIVRLCSTDLENEIELRISRRTRNGFRDTGSWKYTSRSLTRTSSRIASEIAVKLGAPERPDRIIFDSRISDSSYYELYRADAMSKVKNAANDSAIALLTSLTELHPDWALAHRKLAAAMLRYKPGKYKEEIRFHLVECLKISPGDSECLTSLGKIFLEFRDWGEAESSLKLAHHADPEDPRVYFYLSRLDNSRYQDLPWNSKRKLLKRTLDLAPGYELARISLAEWYTNRLERRPALIILDKGLEFDPASLPILLSKSALLLEMSRAEEALVICRKILDIDHTHTGALYNSGIGNLYLKRYEEGIAFFDSSLHNGGSVDNIYYKGVAYQQMGEWETAVGLFQQRLALLQTSDDRVAISSRERIKRLKTWIAERDSTVNAKSELPAG